MENLDADITKKYITEEHKVPYSFKPLQNGRYSILFEYKGTDYEIPAPVMASRSDDLESFIVGSGFLVEDKLDEIDFGEVC